MSLTLVISSGNLAYLSILGYFGWLLWLLAPFSFESQIFTVVFLVLLPSPCSVVKVLDAGLMPCWLRLELTFASQLPLPQTAGSSHRVCGVRFLVSPAYFNPLALFSSAMPKLSAQLFPLTRTSPITYILQDLQTPPWDTEHLSVEGIAST